MNLNSVNANLADFGFRLSKEKAIVLGSGFLMTYLHHTSRKESLAEVTFLEDKLHNVDFSKAIALPEVSQVEIKAILTQAVEAKT